MPRHNGNKSFRPPNVKKVHVEKKQVVKTQGQIDRDLSESYRGKACTATIGQLINIQL